MHAAVGDRLVVHSPHVGGPDRDGEVLEVRHADGTPPYVVRWEDSGRETLFFPGPDVTVQHFPGPRGPRTEPVAGGDET